MKKLFLSAAVLLGLSASAQNMVQTPLTSNRFLLNPALAGVSNDLTIFGGYRNAYAGLEGNPENSVLAGDFGICKNFGGGAILSSESIGVFKNYSMNLAGSYQLRVAKDGILSVGAQVGGYVNSIDFTSLNIEDGADVALTTQQQYGTSWNLGLGAYLKLGKFGLGVSSPQVMNTGYVFENENLSVNQISTLNVFANYEHAVNEKWSVEPIVSFDHYNKSPFLINANLLAKHYKGLWLGYGYATNNFHSAMFGYELLEDFHLNYAFSFGGNGIMQGTAGTHELGIAFKIPNIKNRGNKAELDSLLGLSDSLTNQLKMLKEEKKVLEEQLAEANKKDEEIADLKEQIVEKDKEITALKNKLKNNEGTSISDPGNSDPTKGINGETLQKGKFYLVVESFKTEQRAKNAVVEWKERGIDVFYVKNNKGTWYFITTAKYDNMKAAQKGLAGMRKNLIKDAWIYQHK
jgi:type IX secretion system PorP/SprF family membrane protein